ncbi:MAG: PQQ-like beta-propeller repeat protein [Planctomycetes bacterium]|nr:PQQ-like beta-propeller repeat protein [Planctomycetota bacterium]
MRFWYLGFLFALGCSSQVSKDIPVEGEEKADLRTRKNGVDWPTFLGPTQDGVSPEKGISTTWPKDGLKPIWEAQMGLGYAPPVVSKGRLFHFDRFGENNRLTCRNAETGKLLWKFEFPTDYEDRYGYSPGPRACPVVDEERVYIYGPEGMLHCLNAYNGKEIWKINTSKEYHVHQNFFGVGSVPVIEGDLLIVAIGGSPKGPRPNDLREAKGDGTGIVAFDKKTGKEKYRLSDELSSYSSPTIVTIGDRRWGFYFSRGGLLAFEPATGKIDFFHKWRAKSMESVNASNPVIVGDKVLISECYEKGAALLKIKNGAKPEEIWTDDEYDYREKHLKCHWNTPQHVDGYIYGSSGRHEDEAQLRCVELATGKIMWSEKGLERCSLTRIDGHFLCQAERGDLLLLKINPKKFDVVARWSTELDYPTWAAPVVSNGLMYVRGKNKLVCVELIPAK